MPESRIILPPPGFVQEPIDLDFYRYHHPGLYKVIMATSNNTGMPLLTTKEGPPRVRLWDACRITGMDMETFAAQVRDWRKPRHGYRNVLKWQVCGKASGIWEYHYETGIYLLEERNPQIHPNPEFDGDTYSSFWDNPRLSSAHARIRHLMMDAIERSQSRIVDEACVPHRITAGNILRSFRQIRFGENVCRNVKRDGDSYWTLYRRPRKGTGAEEAYELMWAAELARMRARVKCRNPGEIPFDPNNPDRVTSGPTYLDCLDDNNDDFDYEVGDDED